MLKMPLNCGFSSVNIRTVDTDVVILAVAHFQNLPDIEQIWIAFGSGKYFKYIPVHEIASELCPQKSKGLLFFHSFTGSDVTSYFANQGKKSVWKTWHAYQEVTDSLVKLSSPCSVTIAEERMSKLERFVGLMYHRTSDDVHVSTVRMNLFSRKSRSIEHISPTQTAKVIASVSKLTWNALFFAVVVETAISVHHELENEELNYSLYTVVFLNWNIKCHFL